MIIKLNFILALAHNYRFKEMLNETAIKLALKKPSILVFWLNIMFLA